MPTRPILGAGPAFFHQRSGHRPPPTVGGGSVLAFDYVGSTPQTSTPLRYRVTVCVSLYTKLGSEMNEYVSVVLKFEC